MNEQVQEMIDWIEDNLKEHFSLDRLSGHMGYSPYYCSFKFHQLTGISIRRYLLLRRLYVSTNDLENNRRILDIAFEYDYSSQEAYSRAFKSIFGISPGEYQNNQMPIQSFPKLTIKVEGKEIRMDLSRKIEVQQLQNEQAMLFDQGVLNILNGQIMYEDFKENKLMGNSDYVPFNEAMCVHVTTEQVFDTNFIGTRALGHHQSVQDYTKKVIDPLTNLFDKKYSSIVCWFGEDMFCQMNFLTMLTYLEQSGYDGKVYLNSFREDEFKVTQTELVLGGYRSIYQDVLVRHLKPTTSTLPVLHQAITLYLEMLEEKNPVTTYIQKNNHLSSSELIHRLLRLFPTIGYGDFQYQELIEQTLPNKQ